MADIESLKEHYEIKEDDWSKEVSEFDLKEISRSYCSKWRSLPCYLGMKDTEVVNIDRNSSLVDEDEKKYAFFLQWKQKNGFDATYKQLVGALLKIEHRGDAEKVCKLVQNLSIDSAHPISAVSDTITSAHPNSTVLSDSINVSEQNSAFTCTHPQISTVSTQTDAAGI